MTSEVVVLNKLGVVIAADSAVTSSGALGKAHPRYSKSANKIFDISPHGNVGVTIFSNAAIDSVPWDIAFKEFRANQTGNALSTLDDYVGAIRSFLTANTRLFPPAHLSKVKERLLALAAAYILRRSAALYPDLRNEAKSIGERVHAWTQASVELKTKFSALSVDKSLSVAAFEATLADLHTLSASLQTELSPTALSSIVTSPQVLAELAVAALYKEPQSFLPYTGLVVSGYGDDEIFPSYRTVHVYGHIGTELLVNIPADSAKSISHDEGAWIQAFAQSSMIDVFTQGFGFPLYQVIDEKSRAALDYVIEQLTASGIAIPPETSKPIVDAALERFHDGWTQKNREKHFSPLISVLAGLSVPEMCELAETLLTLESVKERVTSPSESVGGPIDVAVITKSEGLVWVKRKHFFDPVLNLRYMRRASHPEQR